MCWDSGVANDVPALAWFLLSSLVPLALGITALAAVALGDYAQAQALSVRISKVLPKDIRDQLVLLILRTKEQSPLLIAASIIGMVWVAGDVGVIERCLLRLLARPSKGVVRGKLRNLGLAAVVTVVVVLMVAVAAAGTDLVGRLKVNPTAIRLAVPLISLALSTLLCGAVFRAALAGEALRWRAAWAGAAVSAVILNITPTAAGYYLRLVAGRTPVELFLMLAGVLLTCYLAAFGLLLGTGVAARAQLGQQLHR